MSFSLVSNIYVMSEGDRQLKSKDRLFLDVWVPVNKTRMGHRKLRSRLEALSDRK